MKSVLKRIAKQILPRWIQQKIVFVMLARKSLRPIAKRRCNLCGYEGYFGIMGRPARLDVRCPECFSLERHRLLMLAVSRKQIPHLDRQQLRVLHFAPEPVLEVLFRELWSDYRTADLYMSTDLTLNLEDIALGDGSVDLIIANHVLEHVDDHKAGRELSRILSDGGILLCMVPIIEGWETTYENDSVTSDEDRLIHFGQEDHLRYYGRDFRQRIERGGFKLIDEITAEGEDVIQYGLCSGEKVFVFEKLATERMRER